jgi:2-dehydropantoate 2-reductase
VRYVVYGAGAIGGVVGGRLFQAGLDVILIARGPHLEALRARGLRIESPAGSATVPIPAVGHPGEIDWSTDAVVLMAVKSQQTASALAELAVAAPVATPVVCLQNGIANEPAALRLFPNVHAVCVMCPAGHLEPGVVQAWSSPTTGMLDIGRFPRGSDQTSHLVARDLAAATFSSLVVEDIRRWKCRKLLTNLGNVVEAVCGPAERSGPLVGRLISEGEAALAAAGLDVATADEDRRRRGDHLRLGEIAGRTRPGGSSWQSVARATGDIETDYLNGEIVRLGRMHGVPTPANELLQILVREIVSSGRGPARVSAASILDQLGTGPAGTHP